MCEAFNFAFKLTGYQLKFYFFKYINTWASHTSKYSINTWAYHTLKNCNDSESRIACGRWICIP